MLSGDTAGSTLSRGGFPENRRHKHVQAASFPGTGRVPALLQATQPHHVVVDIVTASRNDVIRVNA